MKLFIVTSLVAPICAFVIGCDNSSKLVREAQGTTPTPALTVTSTPWPTAIATPKLSGADAYFAKHPDLLPKPTPTSTPGPTYDATTGKWSDDTGAITPSPSIGWTKEDEYRVFGKGQLKYNNPKNTGVNPKDVRLSAHRGESLLLEGARWADSKEAAKEQ